MSNSAHTIDYGIWVKFSIIQSSFKIKWIIIYECINFKKVAEHCYTGYPNPPLDVIFIICKNVINWLESDDNNVVILHC